MWSFALLGALLLLFPGFCSLVGIIYTRRSPEVHLSGVPDIPAQSPTAIAFIIGGALFAHLLGAAFFVAQEWWCWGTSVCFEVPFDPNPYITPFSPNFASEVTSQMVAYTLLYLAALGALTAWLSQKISRIERVQGLLRPTFAYWLYDLIKQADQSNNVIIAHVLSNLGSNGVFAGYVGAVEAIKLNNSGEISSISLSAVDRFSVIIGPTGVRRASSPSIPMTSFHITSEDISNLNFEVIDLEIVDIDEETAGDDIPPNDVPRSSSNAFWSAMTLGLYNPT